MSKGVNREAQLASAWQSERAFIVWVSEVVLRIEIEETLEVRILLIELQLNVWHVVH